MSTVCLFALNVGKVNTVPAFFFISSTTQAESVELAELSAHSAISTLYTTVNLACKL